MSRLSKSVFHTVSLSRKYVKLSVYESQGLTLSNESVLDSLTFIFPLTRWATPTSSPSGTRPTRTATCCCPPALSTGSGSMAGTRPSLTTSPSIFRPQTPASAHFSPPTFPTTSPPTWCGATSTKRWRTSCLCSSLGSGEETMTLAPRHSQDKTTSGIL